MSETSESAVPAWFTETLARPVATGKVDVRGTSIAYRAWGPERAENGCLLLHGVAAHAHWWDHIGPYLVGAGSRRVVAIDLAGHGDSGRRLRYSIAGWAADVVDLLGPLGLGPRPSVVGHSLGGMVTLAVAGLVGARIGRAVVVDGAVRERTDQQEALRRRRAQPSARVLPTRAEAVARVRKALRHQGLPYILDHIAETSVRQVTSGWAWKVDPLVHDRPAMLPTDLAPMACPVTIVRAEHGLFTDQIERTMVRLLGGDVRVRRVLRAGHQVLLDEPRELTSALLAVL
ncbi:alpha/beta hydrolase [Saccharomonospora sp. NPDC046836]|uniref:alpha/beta fold hydrolase n=1 Tax=Saccharomonospora sp. NPDC046836 TaxID=3156921 RepID=UPI0033E03CC6